MAWLWTLVGGALLGGFIGAATWRLPRGEGLAWPPPRCPRCGRLLRAAELVPLFSFLFLRGRCRGCGAPIGWRYPAIEAATGLAWGVVGATAQRWDELLGGLALAGVAVAAAAIDIEHRVIPNRLTLLAGAAGLALSLAVDAPLRAIAGSLVFGGPFLLVALIRPAGLGMGDVKLAAAFGLFLGPARSGVGFLASVVLAALAGALLLLSGRKSRRDAIPFGPFIGLGAVLAFVAGAPLARGYLGWP